MGKKREKEEKFVWNPAFHSKEDNLDYIFCLYEEGSVEMSELLADYCKLNGFI